MSGLNDGASQSALQPAGPSAHSLYEVTTVLSIGAALIFIAMMLLLARAVRQDGGRPSVRAWVLGGGVAFPAVVLLALFFYSEWHKPPWGERPPDDALIIGVTARMWWWEVRYRDPATGATIATANELHVPVGRPVFVGLASADVIHSFWVPQLGGKMDAVPGRIQHLRLQAERPGVFRGQCAEYCGDQHARMALHVVARPQAEFDDWLARQAAPAAEPAAGSLAARGRAAFLAQRCNACHAVRGVSDGGRLGPDLTHVGSRLFLGAGTLQNHPEALARWIAEVQQLKAGARMPSAGDGVDAPTLEAMAAWLSQLQ